MKQLKNIVFTVILVAGLSGYAGETRNGINLNGINLNGINLNGIEDNGLDWKGALSKMTKKPLVNVQAMMDKEDE